MNDLSRMFAEIFTPGVCWAVLIALALLLLGFAGLTIFG